MLDQTKGFWADLCPNLSIGGDIETDAFSYSEDELENIATRFWDAGYLALASQFPASTLIHIKQGMEILKDQNIPPVYIYLYDQPWALFEKLRGLLTHFLGEDYQLLPNFWAWHLTEYGQSGWPPHRDCDAQTVFDIGGDKMLMSLSLWVPLTDVDPDNACMNVIPRAVEPELPADGSLELDQLESLAKPLAVPAGSVLGWPQDLVHWGGVYKEAAKTPRISLSFEFQNTTFEPLAVPLLTTAHPPDFKGRLTLLEKQFQKYRHIDPILSD
jgi:hypothetical protein